MNADSKWYVIFISHQDKHGLAVMDGGELKLACYCLDKTMATRICNMLNDGRLASLKPSPYERE